MKALICSLLCWCVVSQVCGSDDSPYQARLLALHTRHAVLNTGKEGAGGKGLSAAEEQERLALHGQLAEQDPLWVLLEELSENIRALVMTKPPAEKDAALVEDLKSCLALASGMQGKAKDLKEAEEQTAMMRRFILRRDVKGLGQWSRTLK